MSSGEVVALVVAAACGVALTLLVLLLLSLLRTVRDLRTAVDALQAETTEVLTEVRAAVDGVAAEQQRVEALLGTAQSVSGTVDAASRLAYLALANPVVKTMAVAAGTKGAVRTLRSRNGR